MRGETNGIITRIGCSNRRLWDGLSALWRLTHSARPSISANKIATDAMWIKRLVTVFEWPIPSFFTPIRHYAPEDKTLIFFMIASSQLAELESGAREAGRNRYS